MYLPRTPSCRVAHPKSVRNAAVLNSVDKGIANVTAELVAQGMYEDTLIVLTSDVRTSGVSSYVCRSFSQRRCQNGGDCESGAGEGPDRNPTADRYGPSNNAPLRGRKCEPWDGGTRTMALVSGGFISPSLRGTSSDVLMHVADWFVSCHDITGTILVAFSRYQRCRCGQATLSVIAGVDPSDAVEYRGKLRDIDGAPQKSRRHLTCRLS